MRVSASKLSVLRECRFWARPEVIAPHDPPGPAALTGSRFHSLVDCALGGGEPEVYEGADEVKAQKWMKRWETWWPGFAGGLAWQSERAFLYDVLTGEVEEKERGWAKTDRVRRETQIPVILDLLAIDGGTAHTADFKTGRTVESATVNAQLMGAALVVAKKHPQVSRFVNHIIYTRIRDPFVVDTAEFSLLDVLEFEQQLKEWWAEIPSSEPRPGDHCFKCAARKGVCPVFAASEPDTVSWGVQ